MSPGIEAVTTAALGLALDAASMRQQAIAANIANAGAQGYTPLRVRFEEQLDEARGALRAGGSLDAFTLAGTHPQMVPALDAHGEGEQVRLDVEAARLAENSVRYQALVKGLNRHLAILNTAASDGRK